MARRHKSDRGSVSTARVPSANARLSAMRTKPSGLRSARGHNPRWPRTRKRQQETALSTFVDLCDKSVMLLQQHISALAHYSCDRSVRFALHLAALLQPTRLRWWPHLHVLSITAGCLLPQVEEQSSITGGSRVSSAPEATAEQHSVDAGSPIDAMGSEHGGDSVAKNEAESTIAKLGEPCSIDGQKACTAQASAQRLICRERTWRDNGNCEMPSSCATTGPFAGDCESFDEVSCATCDGVCVDTTSDAKHCGGCNHSCLGGMCVASKCQPVTLASGQRFTNPFAMPTLTVDRSRVYWVTDDSVLSFDIQGQSIKTLAPVQKSARTIAADATHLYWLEENATPGDTTYLSRLHKMPLAGGTIITLLTGGPSPDESLSINNFSIAHDDLYFGDSHVGGVARLPCAGGNIEQLVLGNIRVLELTADANGVYWVESAPAAPEAVSSILRSSDLSGNHVLNLSSAKSIASATAADDELIWWEMPFGSMTGKIVTMPSSGGLPRVLFEPAAGGRMTADRDFVYYVDGSRLIRVARDQTGSYTTLLSTPDPIIALTNDATSLYWLTKTGLVQSLAK